MAVYAEPFHGNEPSDRIDAITHLLQRPDWHAEAACRGRTDVMFPKSRNRSQRWAEAIAVCDGCPVRTPCAEAADERPEIHGVWGGQRRMPEAGKVSVIDLMVDVGGWWSAPQLAETTGWTQQMARRRLREHLLAGRLECRNEGRTVFYRPTGAK